MATRSIATVSLSGSLDEKLRAIAGADPHQRYVVSHPEAQVRLDHDAATLAAKPRDKRLERLLRRSPVLGYQPALLPPGFAVGLHAFELCNALIHVCNADASSHQSQALAGLDAKWHHAQK